MSDSPLPPDPADDGHVFETYEQRIAFHLERSRKRSPEDAVKRLASRIWLMDRGIITDTRRPSFVSNPDARKESPSPGNPRQAGEKNDPKAPREAIITCLEDIEEEEYEWLWPGRIPLRKVSLIAGDGGAGKSTLMGSLIATITTGGCWPDIPDEPVERGSVIVLSAEESPASDIRPRLRRFGADVSKVHILSAIRASDGGEDPFSIARDVPSLAAAAKKIGDVRLVVVDPIGSYMRGVDTYKDADVRDGLKPFFDFADDARLAGMLVAHLTKQMSSDVQKRIQGAMAFVNASRMVWFYSHDPRRTGGRMLSFIKGNAVDKTITALSATLERGALVWDPEPVAMSADDVCWKLAQQAQRGDFGSRRGPKSDRTNELMEFILKRLEDGAIALVDLKAEAKDVLDVTRSMFHHAVKKLGRKVHVFDGDDGRKHIEATPELDLTDSPEESPGGSEASPNDAPQA